MKNKTIAPQLHVLLRFALAALSLGIMMWLVRELNSGTIHWSASDYISNETIGQYLARSPIAKVTGTLLFVLLSAGCMAYAARPRILSHPFIVLPWLAILIVLGLMLKHFSEKIGP